MRLLGNTSLFYAMEDDGFVPPAGMIAADMRYEHRSRLEQYTRYMAMTGRVLTKTSGHPLAYPTCRCAITSYTSNVCFGRHDNESDWDRPKKGPGRAELILAHLAFARPYQN